MTGADITESLEKWLAIPGHEGYEISNRGRIRSWKLWRGCNIPPPRLLKIQVRAGRRHVQLGLHGGTHYIDDLMHAVWSAAVPDRMPTGEPMWWRRIMLSEREHKALVDLLGLINANDARRLLPHIRSAKRVLWDEPISPTELEES